MNVPTTKIASYIVAIAVLMISTTTQASTIQLSWTPPTEYEDGTPLLEQDLDFYTVYINGTPATNLDVIVGTWSAEIVFTVPGSHQVALTVTDLNGQESQLSNTQVFTVGPRTPKAPTLQVVVVQ
jgi:hypothetical protein